MKEKWIYQEPECPGNYRFDGKLYVTRNIILRLSILEVIQITRKIEVLVQEYNGIDYLQTFKNQEGVKIYCIDCHDKSLPDNYWTMLFVDEY